MGLNGGPKFVPNETVSFAILTENQVETGGSPHIRIGSGLDQQAPL
jgi:hypothetical protein